MASSAYPPPPAAPETVSLGPGGEVRVPERLRARLGWRERDRLVLTADETRDVKVLTLHDAVRSVRGMLAPQSAGRHLVDELAEDRRREGEREQRRTRRVREEDAATIARLRPLTKAAGLGLGDRACLALAKRLGVPALTAERSWPGLANSLGVQVRSTR
jgi:bifunctional DNA-binding transcriptional regulator/antitoxin component of YhaV-PrlF toxin-antitoxin module